MKLQGKKTGAFAGFIGYVSQENPTVDPPSGVAMLTVRYRDAGALCFKDYKTIAEFTADWEDYTPEPDPSYLIVKIQKLENSVKELDERLKTVEEITERLLREDNEQILGEVKRYEPETPRGEIFEEMKHHLRDWIEKNKIKCVQTFIHTEPDGRRGVKFFDMTNDGDNHLTIIGWPTVGLVDGDTYTPDELLITGEAGKE